MNSILQKSGNTGADFINVLFFFFFNFLLSTVGSTNFICFIGRCSAVGLVTSFGYLGVAICPLIMRIELLAHAVVPLGVMGCLCLTAGLLCHFLLPKTQDSTAEDFDGSSQMTRFQGCVPRVHWTKNKTSEIGHDRVEMVDSCTIDVCNENLSVRFSP